jgi:hypothetical protein
MPIPLRNIRKFDDLVRYLETELDWPVDAASFDDLTFEYQPAELGLKDEDAVKIKKIYQLRPLASSQPWGIFFVEFEKKKLPVVVLRRILSHLVIKKRESANKADRAAWKPEDILFISAFGEEESEQREIAFAHFQNQSGDLPTLRVLGWDGSDTPLKLEFVAATLKEKLHWPKSTSDADAWRSQWRAPFRHRIGHVIKTADALAETLAGLAKRIRAAAQRIMRAESEHGALTKLYKAFQAALIHDLKPEDFADTYAQTITYGLLTAAISRTEMSEGASGTFVKADDIADIVPVTNPFLKEMLQMFLKAGGRKGGIDFDELGIQDVVELLRGEETDLPAILRDFGNKTQGEDPVIHFYEHFLSAYNKQLKIQRGVFYTPKPVVSYIVRSVNELLQTEFGIEDGLASTVTWGEMAKWNKDLKIPDGVMPDSHFVQILDPATGTATFLVEVVDVIYRHLKAKWDKGGLKSMPTLPPSSFTRSPGSFDAFWNQYVPLALLPRLHGYELMMAPYAIAHMKIGLKLFETGYRFGTDERARIYLTNALEPGEREPKLIAFEALAHEAAAVNEIKWNKRFTVVIGNPPYAGESANEGAWISSLIRDYHSIQGESLGEANPRWLQDDYVKFIRLTQFALGNAGIGIVSLITNHAYLDNATFRGARFSLLSTFEAGWFLDLHGNTKKKERQPDGSTDVNVFEIQQGVAVCFLLKRGLHSQNFVKHADLFGSRECKYKILTDTSLISTQWNPLNPINPFYLLIPQDQTLFSEYQSFIKITDAMPVHSNGVVTARDHLCISWSEKESWNTVQTFIALKPEEARQSYQLGEDSRDWQVKLAQADLKKDGPTRDHVVPICYRPFDLRWTYFTGKSRGFLCMPRGETMTNMLSGNNMALITSRMTKGETFQHVQATKTLSEAIVMSAKTSNNGFIFPLYILPVAKDGNSLNFRTAAEANFTRQFLSYICTTLDISKTDRRGIPVGLTPEDIFHYAYSVLHSPSYRSRYAEFLKIDFPRLPLTSSLKLFRSLAKLGSELVSLHLMESPKLNLPIAEYIGGRGSEVEKVSWSKNTVWIDKAQTTGFKGVREDVWHFHIGGYQVCEKWLKDRKGRTLTADDRTHYQKIIVALSETIRLMQEIDAVIESHGGWPGAFQTKVTDQTEAK